MEKTKRLLFLDDVRYPIEAYHYTKQDIFLRSDWHIVRNYGQFVSRILEKGLPEMISFDHDLADEHYLKPDAQEFVEKQATIVQNGLPNTVGKTIWIYPNSIVIP